MSVRHRYKRFYISDQENRLFCPFCTKVLDLYLQEIRWLHANPSIYESKKEILEEYIVHTEELKQFEENMVEIIKNKGDEDGKVWFIVGEKGSGKTFRMNYFLNAYTGWLNDKGCTWIRIDIAKVYRIMLSIKKKMFDILELKNLIKSYLYAQVIYVYLRYGSEKSKFGRSDKVFASISLSEIENKLKKQLSTEDFKKFKREWNIVIEKVINSPQYTDSLEDKPISWPFSFYVYEAIIELLREKKKKILLFIDGIDNVDYHLAFNNMINALKKFIDFLSKEANKNGIYRNIFISLRPESKEFLNSIRSEEYISDSCKMALESHYSYTYRTINIESGSIVNLMKNILEKFERRIISQSTGRKLSQPAKHLLRVMLLEAGKWGSCNIYNSEFGKKIIANIDSTKKLKDILHNNCDKNVKCLFPRTVIYKNHVKRVWRKLESDKDIPRFIFYLYEIVDLLPGDLVESFIKFGKKFHEKIYEQLKRKEILDDLSLKEDAESITRHIYRNNVRNYIDDIIKSFTYVYFYLISSGKEKKSLGSGRLIMEALFRDGNFYSPIWKDKLFVAPYQDISFINLLNVAFLDSAYTTPIVSIAFLYFLIKQGEVSVETFVEKVFKESTKVNRKYIKAVAKLLLEYGYIDLAPAESFVITTKGKIAFEYTLRDINVFSSLAYNGLFKEEYSKLLVRYKWKSDRESLNPWRYYLKFTLRNTVVLLAFLNEEISLLKAPYAEELRSKIFNIHLKKDFLEFLQKFLGPKSDIYLEPENCTSNILYELFEEGISDSSLKSKIYSATDALLKSEVSKLAILHKITKEHLKELSKNLSFREKVGIIKLLGIFNKNLVLSTEADKILDNYYLHSFLFGNFSDADFQRRLEKLQKEIESGTVDIVELTNKLKENLRTNE